MTGFGKLTKPESEGDRAACGTNGDECLAAKTLRRRERRSTTHFSAEYKMAIPIAATKHWTSAIERSQAHWEKAALDNRRTIPIDGFLIHLNSKTKYEPMSTNKATGAHNTYRGAVQTLIPTV